MTDTKTPLNKFAIGDSLIPIVRLAFDCRIPLLLAGHSGIGKSQFVHDQAAAMGRRVVVLNMALFESAAELLGLPYIVDGVTRYATPGMLPWGAGWILLIEEATRAAPHVMAAFYEFLTSRCIGDYELPEDCAIIACMNPPGPEYDGHAFDRAMSDRFMQVEVMADRDEWLRWAIEMGVHSAILDTVREDPRLFELASPRTWLRASTLLHRAQHQGMDRAMVERTMATALASVEAAHAVCRYLDGKGEQEAIAPVEVLKHYGHDLRLGRRVRELLQQGRTDTIEKLVFGVNELLVGDALAGLVAAGAFDLVALEQFALDIPGDRSAALLSTFAANRASGTTLEVDPQQALISYPRTALFRLVSEWRQADQGHRLQALAHRIVDHLDQLEAAGKIAALRRTPPVRESLDSFCKHLEEHAGLVHKARKRLRLGAAEAEAE